MLALAVQAPSQHTCAIDTSVDVSPDKSDRARAAKAE